MNGFIPWPTKMADVSQNALRCVISCQALWMLRVCEQVAEVEECGQVVMHNHFMYYITELKNLVLVVSVSSLYEINTPSLNTSKPLGPKTLGWSTGNLD